MNKILTIGIPTYNRRKQLIRLLKSIESQNCVSYYSIVISDNCSDYSVAEAIDEVFTGEFRDTIEVVRRNVNGGGDYNISSMFSCCNSTLFWLMGDDDEMLPGSILRVIENYRNYPEIPVFKYMMNGAFESKENIRMKNVDDFVRCFKKGYLYAGIIFMSNNIYNIDLCRPYLGDCLYYGYCSVSQLIPMMHCLVDSEYEVLLCKDPIVKYNAPEGDHWNYLKIVTSLSTMLDINWGNHHKEIKKYFRTICSYFGLGHFLIDNIKIEDKSYRKYVYKKGMKTVFSHHRNILDLLALTCYWLQRFTHIKFLTGFYVSALSVQTCIQDKFREKAKNSATAAKWFYFLKKHVKLMK